MNKTELISAVAEKSGVPKRVTGEVLDALLKTIVDTVASGSEVQLVGFGTFTSVKKNGREWFNPITKEPFKIEPSTVVKFRTGKAFKDAVNQQIRLPI